MATLRVAVTAVFLWAGAAVCAAQQPQPLGDEFQVTTATAVISGPAVSGDSAGNFVIVWQAYGLDGSAVGVFGRRYDAAGNALGPSFQVNTYTTGTRAGSGRGHERCRRLRGGLGQRRLQRE